MYQTQQQVSAERYKLLMSRYQQYLAAADDITRDPVRVFDPLNSKQLEELELIRGVSRDLQAQKEDDMRKAAQAREEERLAAEKEVEKENPQEEECQKEE